MKKRSKKVSFNSYCSFIQNCTDIHLYNNHHVVKSTRLRPVLEYMFMLYISLIIRCNCRPLWLSAFLFGFSLRALKHNNWFYLRSSLLNKKLNFDTCVSLTMYLHAMIITFYSDSIIIMGDIVVNLELNLQEFRKHSTCYFYRICNWFTQYERKFGSFQKNITF